MLTQPSEPPLPWRRLIALWLSSRLFLVVMGWLGHMALPKGEFYGNGVLDFSKLVLRWDGAWYWGILQEGYGFRPDAQSNVAFFPGFPLAMGLFKPLFFFTDLPFPGVLVSNLCLLLGGVVLWRLATQMQTGRPDQTDRADLAAALLFFNPVGIFYSVVYTESLFLLCCTSCFLALSRKRFWIAGLCGVAAALTRNGGLFLCLPILWEYVRAVREDPERRFWRWEVLSCGLPALGTLSFFSVLYVKFGDPLVFTRSQIFWSRQLTWPWVPFSNERMGGFPEFYKVWFVGAVVLASVLLIAGLFSRLRGSLWIFAALLLLFNLSANHLESIPRYVSVIFPLYLVVADRPPVLAKVGWLAVVGSAMLLSLSVILFVNGFWFT